MAASPATPPPMTATDSGIWSDLGHRSQAGWVRQENGRSQGTSSLFNRILILAVARYVAGAQQNFALQPCGAHSGTLAVRPSHFSSHLGMSFAVHDIRVGSSGGDDHRS